MALSNQSKIRLIAFDLDGTLVADTVYVWTTLHAYFNTDPKRRRRAKKAFFSKEISYESWFMTDLILLKERGATFDAIQKAFNSMRVAKGAMECLAALRQRGYKLAVISGSLDLVLERFFSKKLFDHVMINRISFDQSGRIAGGSATPYDLDGKADGLAELARREGLELSQCAFVGDNVNDIEVMRAAGFSLGVYVKAPEVIQAADEVIEGDDLRLVLPYFPGVELWIERS